MQNDQEEMNRRGFLRFSAVALAGAKAAVRGMAQTKPKFTERLAPVHSIQLRSNAIEVTLDRNDGLPVAYKLHANGALLHGEDTGQPVTATICTKSPWKFTEVAV